MNTENRQTDPLDREIERDVAELRRLLEKVEGPSEPHPAYYQNFLVRLRDRIDRDRPRHHRWTLVGRFSAIGAAAVALVLVTTTVIQYGGNLPTVADRPENRPAASTQRDGRGDYAPLFAEESSSIILTKNDVQMLNAIMSEDDNELFKAIASAD